MRSGKAIAVALGCGALAGCTQEIADFGIDMVSPEVVSISPEDGSVGVDRQTTIIVTFSEPIDPLTVSASAFQLFRNSESVPGTISTTATSAAMTVISRLEDLAEYEIVVNDAITDIAGNPLRAGASAAFVSEDLEWEEPFDVSPGGTGAAWGGAAVGGVDETFLIWSDSAGVWTQRIVGGSPAPAHLLDAGAETGSPSIAATNDGHALAIWTRSSSSGRNDLFFAKWEPGSQSWSSPGLVETDDSGFVAAPALAMNGSGYAVAAWGHSDTLTPPFRMNIFARVYSVASGWYPIAVPLEGSSQTAEPPQVGVGADGTFVVNWIQSDGTGPRLWAATSESAAEVIETTADVSSARSYVDPNGHPFVVWGEGFNYFMDGAWNGPEPLEAALSGAASSTRAMLAWHDLAANEIKVADLSSSGVPEDIQVISSGGSVLTTGIDDSGRAFVLSLKEENGFQSLFSSRRNATSWAPPELIEHDDAGDVGYVTAVDVGQDGEGVVTYLRYDGVGSRVWCALLR